MCLIWHLRGHPHSLFIPCIPSSVTQIGLPFLNKGPVSTSLATGSSATRSRGTGLVPMDT